MTDVTLSEVRDFDALGARWRALEQTADLSFFQSWTWTGCLPAERFPDPILAEAQANGETVGLALFNRRRDFGRDRLYLGESGCSQMDRLAIEHNGPLVARERPGVGLAILRAAAARYDLILSGMTDQAPGHILKTQPSPFARSDAAWFARRSANTRQQIQRSDRAVAAHGPIVAARADTAVTAHAWLDAMAAMHQATWAARGKPGSFADPFFGRFHHALIQRGMPRAEIELWRVTAGTRLVGILYNFRCRGRVSAYQSGFAYDWDDKRAKPGLSCHRQAIEAGASDGVSVYDFLAGADRYKASLADGTETMRWLIAGAWWSPRLLAVRARGAMMGGGEA